MNKYLIITIACLLFTTVACKDDINQEDKFLEDIPGAGSGLGENNPYWVWVSSFPGWVDAVEQRETSVSVVVDAKYEKVDMSSQIGFKEKPWFSTGMYAAPGEPVELTIPANMKGKVDWRIGAWKCVIPEGTALKRFNKVFETATLDEEVSEISSWFGGHIYIVPKEPLDGPITVGIKGAVKSPDFILGVTDPAEWKTMISNTKVPFGELRGKNCIWTMPTTTLATIENPKELIEFYDDVIENDFNAFHGFTKNAADAKNRSLSFPVRIVQDIQLEAGESHPGYPIVFDMADKTIGTNLNDMKRSTVAIKFYSEIGKNFRTWCWAWLDESGDFNSKAALLPYYYSRNRTNQAFPEDGTAGWDIVVDQYVVNNKNVNKNFDTETTLDENNARLIPMIQLVQKYGWGLFAYLGQTSRDLEADNEAVLKLMKATARREFFCKRVSEYANANMAPFFDAWGIKYSSYAKTDMEKLPVYAGNKFWETWERSKIPNNVPLTPSSIKLPDNNYNNISSMLDQTAWSIHSVFESPGGAQENTVECLIDGRQTENVNKNPGGTHWGMPNQLWRPVFDPQPWIIFDMKNAINVSDVHLWYRNITALHLHPNKFTVDGKLKEDDPWTSMGTFSVPKWNTNLLKKWNSFATTTVVPARYLRLTLISAFPKNVAAVQERGNANLEEFTISGTIYIDGSVGDPSPENDSDFPIYN